MLGRRAEPCGPGCQGELQNESRVYQASWSGLVILSSGNTLG